MNDELADVFDTCEPPTGGLARLQVKLDGPRHGVWLPVLAGGLGLAAVLLVVRPGAAPEPLPDAHLAVLLAGEGGETVSGMAGTAVLEVGRSEDVAFYWVSAGPE